MTAKKTKGGIILRNERKEKDIDIKKYFGG
jgi:hypothetical protein